MDFHEKFTNELYKNKSLSAFIWLINFGRELEFNYNQKSYFVSKDGSKKHVSLWFEKEEQAFDSVEDLIENARIGNKKFYDIWNDFELGILY